MIWLLGEDNCRVKTAFVLEPVFPSTTFASPIVTVGTITVALRFARLLIRARSGSLAEMNAVLLRAPACVGWKVRFTVALPLFVSVPSAQMIAAPLFVVVPWEADAEMNAA